MCAEARGVRQGLHALARARDADLLVIGASRQDEIYRDLVGDDARELLEGAPCAVAVAPVGYADRRGPLRRIGVAYDRSPESDRALAMARNLAADRHAQLSAFQAVPGPGHIEDTIEEEVAQALERIDKLGGVDAHAEYGEPARELRRYGRSVDLLVLGSHKHSPIGRLLGAGTAQRLADEPLCRSSWWSEAEPRSGASSSRNQADCAAMRSLKVRDDCSPTRVRDSAATSG